MSLTNPNKVITEERLSEFYQGILPYLGGMPDMLANKFSKGDLYSTDEKIVGQWIDGKPLYQKTVVVNSPASAGVDTIVASFDASTQPRELFGLLDNTIPLNYNGTNEWYTKTRLDPSFSNNVVTGINIRMIVAGYTNRVTRITIRYTKTTDSAVEMGDDTDYSTTEKIVGTWIDGKPIYQKTIDCGTLVNATTKSVSHNISNIDYVVNAFGFAVNTDKSIHLPLPFSYPLESDCIGIGVSTTKINIVTGSDRTALTTSYVTIQYTKTTD